MAGFDPNQPRDEIGRWTAVRAARVASGLAYKTETYYGDTTVHMLSGKSVVSEDMVEEFKKQGALKTIFNVETKTWHIAEQAPGQSGMDVAHADFLEQASEGYEEKYGWQSEFLQSRGYIDFETMQMEMYDLTSGVEYGEFSDWDDPVATEKLLNVKELVQKYPLMYVDPKTGETKPMKFEFFDFYVEILGYDESYK